MGVVMLSSLFTLDKASKLVLCSLNRSLGRHPCHPLWHDDGVLLFGQEI